MGALDLLLNSLNVLFFLEKLVVFLVSVLLLVVLDLAQVVFEHFVGRQFVPEINTLTEPQ